LEELFNSDSSVDVSNVEEEEIKIAHDQLPFNILPLISDEA